MSICTNPIEMVWVEYGNILAGDALIEALSAKMRGVCEKYHEKLDAYSGDDPDAEDWLLDHGAQYNEEIASIWEAFVRRAKELGVDIEA